MGMRGWQKFSAGRAAAGAAAGVAGIRLALVQVWATATIAALVAGPGLGPGDHRRLLPQRLRPGPRRRGGRGRSRLLLELLATTGSLWRMAHSVTVAAQRRLPRGCREHARPHRHAWHTEGDNKEVIDGPAHSRPPRCTRLAWHRRRRLRRRRPRRRRQRRRRRQGHGDPLGPGFDEAALVASMYARAPRERRLQRRAEARRHPRPCTSASSPRTVDIVPEYVGGIADLSTPRERRRREADHHAATRRSRIDAAKPLLETNGITLLDPPRPLTERVLRDQGVRRGQRRHRRSPTSRASRSCSPPPPTARGATDCEGGLQDLRHRHHQGAAAGLRPRRRPTSRCSTARPSSARPAPLDGSLEAQGLVLLEDDKGDPARAEPRAGRLHRVPGRQPRRGRPAARADGRADNDTLAPLINEVSADRAKPEDVAEKFLEQAGLIS